MWRKCWQASLTPSFVCPAASEGNQRRSAAGSNHSNPRGNAVLPAFCATGSRGGIVFQCVLPRTGYSGPHEIPFTDDRQPFTAAVAGAGNGRGHGLPACAGFGGGRGFRGRCRVCGTLHAWRGSTRRHRGRRTAAGQPVRQCLLRGFRRLHDVRPCLRRRAHATARAAPAIGCAARSRPFFLLLSRGPAAPAPQHRLSVQLHRPVHDEPASTYARRCL